MTICCVRRHGNAGDDSHTHTEALTPQRKGNQGNKEAKKKQKQIPNKAAGLRKQLYRIYGICLLDTLRSGKAKGKADRKKKIVLER